jgi:uncharacterized protein with HEPN domain
MPREYREYLVDILRAAEAIKTNVSSITFEEFAGDSNRVKSVVLDLVIIGEASNHIPDDIQVKSPEVAWAKIVGLRNMIVHGYWLLNYHAIWETACKDVPDLHHKIETLLEELDSE